MSGNNTIMFISHGGGPMPLLEDKNHTQMIDTLKRMKNKIAKPSAILVISAHWETQVATITSGAAPPLIYDYNGFPKETWAALLCLALVSQILGHTLYNWSLQWIKAGTVSIALLGEPVGAILLAWLFLSEGISLQQGIGGFLILLGVFLIATKKEFKPQRQDG